MSKRSNIALTLGILGFILILTTTWVSLIFKTAYFYESIIRHLFIGGVVGCILFCLSTLVLYKMETATKPSVWRLGEKITVISGFFLIFMSWFFSGFRGTLEKALHPLAMGLSFIGVILTVAGFISYSERVRKRK